MVEISNEGALHLESLKTLVAENSLTGTTSPSVAPLLFSSCLGPTPSLETFGTEYTVLISFDHLA